MTTSLGNSRNLPLHKLSPAQLKQTLSSQAKHAYFSFRIYLNLKHAYTNADNYSDKMKRDTFWRAADAKIAKYLRSSQAAEGMTTIPWVFRNKVLATTLGCGGSIHETFLKMPLYKYVGHLKQLTETEKDLESVLDAAREMQAVAKTLEGMNDIIREEFVTSELANVGDVTFSISNIWLEEVYKICDGLIKDRQQISTQLSSVDLKSNKQEQDYSWAKEYLNRFPILQIKAFKKEAGGEYKKMAAMSRDCKSEIGCTQAGWEKAVQAGLWTSWNLSIQRREELKSLQKAIEVVKEASESSGTSKELSMALELSRYGMGRRMRKIYKILE